MFDDLIIDYLGEQKLQPSVALVPGSFKPPHAGHLDMVKKYSKMADKVIVLISQPSAKSERKTATGKVISPLEAQEIFQTYVDAARLPNVEVVISNHPSPVKSAYDYAETLEGVDVIFGASQKGNDWKRWAAAPA